MANAYSAVSKSVNVERYLPSYLLPYLPDYSLTHSLIHSLTQSLMQAMLMGLNSLIVLLNGNFGASRQAR